MRVSLVGLAISLGSLLPATTVTAQVPPSPEIVELKREIAQAKAMIAKWTSDLAALEERLARAEARKHGATGLRFPWDIERAMIGEGIERSLRGGAPSQLEIQEPRGQFRRWETAPPMAPRR